MDYRVNEKIKFGLITLAACLGVSITAALGSWQLSRAAQKAALQADIKAQSAKPPITAKSLRALPDPSQPCAGGLPSGAFGLKKQPSILKTVR